MQSLESDVLLASNGDEAAFRRLVDESANTVCSIALAIVRNVQASEDVAQEVFLAAWSNLKKLRNPASFLPWLRQVTRNQAHLWRREHARELTDEATLATTLDPRPTAADHLLADEERRVLAEALDRLPDDAREVLIIYYREESSARQVALLLGISEEAVRQRLSRARSLLREEVLSRFAATVARTAPGVAFGSMIAAALTFSAPAASAAVVASSATGVTAATVAKSVFASTALGWLGVILGMRYLEPVLDEEEGRQLRRFRNVVLLVITIGSVVVALSLRSVMQLLIAVQSLYFVLGGLYFLWLPRILRRRPEKETRRRWLRATVGRAAGAAVGGAMLMALALALR